jgi:hypothetical protein
MTALAKDRKAPQYGTPDDVIPRAINFPVAASTTIYAGSMVATNASGDAVPSTASAALKLWGRAETQVVNTGAAGAKRIDVRPGVFAFVNSAAGVDLIAAADVGKTCYAADDNVVALTSGGGTRPEAGVVFPFDPNNTAAVQVGVGPGFANPFSSADLGGATSAFRARGVATANVADLGAFTVAGNDGITFVAGDVVLLSAQTTAAQNGPYVVGTVGGGTAPLTRPEWYPAASTQPLSLEIQVGSAGTVFKNTTWRTMLSGTTFVVDTTDPKWYPKNVSGTTALSSGTFTISTVPIFSAKSTVLLSKVASGGTVTSTVGYHPTVAGADGITPGVIGVAAAIVQAIVAAGTINTADTSTLHWTIINQA